MKRRFSGWFGSVALVVLVVAGPALAQERTDKIEYRDPKTPGKTGVRLGNVADENVAKVTILTGANQAKVEIPVNDIIEVNYASEPGEAAGARTADRNKDYEKALSLYQDALKAETAKKTPNKFIQIHLEFRILKIKTQQVEGGGQRAPVIADLRKFRTSHPDARQTLECLDLLNRLLSAEGQPTTEVTDAFKAIRTKYASDKELVARCDLFEMQSLLQEGETLYRTNKDEGKKKFAAAQEKLKAMLGVADKSTALDIRIALAECKATQGQLAEGLKDLDDLLKEAGDDHTKAAVYLGRGDCNRLSEKYKEAQWDYLWVDVIYNQDREQHAKALFYLSEVFVAQNQPDKAGATKNQLQNDPNLKDTRYQRMAAATK